MISKELKKMSRRELMDIIYQMKKNEQQMQEEIASLQEALQDKRISLSVAGSVADAAASITNVFSAAQMTADLYLQDIARGHSFGHRFLAVPDGTFVLVEDGRETVFGEALLVADGEIMPFCGEGESRRFV